MYKIPTSQRRTTLEVNKTYEGETIEQKVERITQNGEPIKDGAPLIYTDRKDGVQAGYNIRTDRFEVAVEAMDKVHKSDIAKRDNKPKMEIVKDAGSESTQGTGTLE
jgi:hypothetical protein